MGLINIQGYIGLGIGVLLSVLLGLQVVKTHHVEHQLATMTTSYHQVVEAAQQTEINYRRAADLARKLDADNKVRVAREQTAISQERDATYEARIADARARAERLQPHTTAPAHPGNPGAAPVPSVPSPAGGSNGSAPQAGLSPDDALVATEQAIQLDELQHWVTAQHAVDVNGQ